jgi:hypothetical protein
VVSLERTERSNRTYSGTGVRIELFVVMEAWHACFGIIYRGGALIDKRSVRGERYGLHHHSHLPASYLSTACQMIFQTPNVYEGCWDGKP